jgi:exosome complex component RRP46
LALEARLLFHIHEGEADKCVAPRERHLETLIHNTLRSIILVRSIPRTLVQVTLQVRSLPEEEASTGVSSVCQVDIEVLHPG